MSNISSPIVNPINMAPTLNPVSVNPTPISLAPISLAPISLTPTINPVPVNPAPISLTPTVNPISVNPDPISLAPVNPTPISLAPTVNPISVNPTPISLAPVNQVPSSLTQTVNQISVNPTPISFAPMVSPISVNPTPISLAPTVNPISVNPTPISLAPMVNPISVNPTPISLAPTVNPVTVNPTLIHGEEAEFEIVSPVPVLPILPVIVAASPTAIAVNPDRPRPSKRGRTRKRSDKPKVEENRQVYVIHSRSPLSVVIDEIKQHIPEDLIQNQTNLIGPCRIVFSRGQETDRTICVFNCKIFEEMKKKGLSANRMWSDFKVVPFRLRDSIMPQAGQRHLFMILPSQLTITDVRKQLVNSLKILSDFGIVKPNSYEILIPFKSRESDDHVGKCFIIWSNGISGRDIAITRIVLHDSRWVDSEGYPIEGRQGLKCCFWARISNPKNIKMSPADRSYTHNHREQRQNKIQHHNHNHQSERRHSRKQFSPENVRINKNQDNHYHRNKQVDTFKLVMPDVPQLPTVVAQQPVYEPLSAITQPIPIRGYVATTIPNVSPNPIPQTVILSPKVMSMSINTPQLSIN